MINKHKLLTSMDIYRKLDAKIQHGILLVVSALVFSTGLAMFSHSAEAMKDSDILTQRDTMTLLLPEIVQATRDEQTPEQTPGWHTVEVKRGDTLSQIFDRAGLGPQQVFDVVSLGKQVKTLKRIIPGQIMEIKTSEDNSLEELVYRIDERNSLHLKRNDQDRLDVQFQERDYDTHVAFAKGIIRSSLFEAAQEAGIPETVIMDLAYIFGWDVDFAQDIREGDHFIVMYEEHFLDGSKIRNGDILAAEFTNQGQTFSAIRYTDDKGNAGYYTPDGKSMKKAFLRTPVDFKRISSRYGKRKHPTLKTWRKHKGVDYAARRGTPIKASGNGKIIFRGVKGGYGKTVIIDHGNGYRTLYAHMNNYNRKAGWGKQVKQGQVIGYVGSTGRATGPHLHYEFRVNGSHRNPLRVKLPDAAPIARKYKEDFAQQSRILLAQFSYLKDSTIAYSSL